MNSTVSTSATTGTTVSTPINVNMVTIPEDILQQMMQLIATTKTTARVTPDTQFQVMADLSKTIGDFDGNDLNDQSAKFWITNINAMAELHRWPLSFKLQTARPHMIEPAKNWLLMKSIVGPILKLHSEKHLYEKTVILKNSLQCKNMYRRKVSLLLLII